MDYRFNPTIAQAAARLAAGDVVAYPTEAVWGLGCDPFNDAAVEHLLALKKRPVEKGVILIASGWEEIAFLVDDLPQAKQAQLKASWPGPHTWLVPHNHRVPYFIHGRFDSVAVRVSAHPVVKALCNAFGGPIVSTSANPQALPPATNSLKARCYFGPHVFYCPGVVGSSAKPSTITDLMTGEIIRA